MTDTLKTFTMERIAGQKFGHESAELSIYLEHFAKPGDYQLDVQVD
jgi:hypothetical protein